MITKTQTRKQIRSVLDEAKSKGEIIEYPMTKFRHAIFDTVEKCKALKFHSWKFDAKNELSTCILFYQFTSFECTYYYKTDMVIVNSRELKDGEEKLVSTIEIPVSELAEFIYKNQPKVRVVLKKKA